jgi:hypothetical protein
MLFNGFEVRHHQREGLVHAQFAGSQFSYSFGIRRVTGKVKSAQAFDGNDLSICQETRVSMNGIIGYQGRICRTRIPLISNFHHFLLTKPSVHIPHATGCAWNLLFVGSLYSRSQSGHSLKSRHRREWTVVGNVFDDGEARSAVGAVDEGIAIAAVVGSKSSRRQSSQMATSGEMGWKAPSTLSEWIMSKG